ncbi:MAG: hypothetical protein F7C34_00340 [Desulfurococcales archaeon]|nr:hypothetical protein [Desulfurococcales archaeon]
MSSSIIFYVLLVLMGAIAGMVVQHLDYLVLANQEAQKYILQHEEIDILNGEYGLSLNPTYYYIRLNISNTGNTLIYDYQHTDIILTIQRNNINYIVRVPFRGDVGNLNNLEFGWYVEGIYDSTGNFIAYTDENPVYWEPNTVIRILIVIPITYRPDTGSTVTISIATPQGGYDFLRFTWEI